MADVVRVGLEGETQQGDPGLPQAPWQELLDRSVLVRNCTGWPRLDGCLRVTIGTPEENDVFLSAMQEVMAFAAAVRRVVERVAATFPILLARTVSPTAGTI